MPDPASPTAAAVYVRRARIGAELVSGSLVSFRVWAPDHDELHVVVDDVEHAMRRDGADGYFRADVTGRVGSRYGFHLGQDTRIYPDPASRWQPDGPHGLSAVVDPTSYAWGDVEWPGLTLTGQVLYELHIGTFTADGTWRAAARELPRLRDLGVTAVQVMPVGDFPGAFGWGYDGVNWYAPTRLYGRPDDMRAFVDAAHAHGLGVLLDVVYNHLGPDGNYLARFARDYFTDRHPNDWGASVDYDGPRAEHVRELVLANVEYWIREFHVDGFRLDATHSIHDASEEHLLAELTERARAAAGGRPVLVVAENDVQHALLLRPGAAGGHGLDALYSEDFHHAARVALTGQREAYYSDYSGTAEELLAAARWGFLFQGQHYAWRGGARGMPALDLRPEQFICFLENHDQVANSSTGRRLPELTDPGALRALTALLLLGPCTPMLFQGQEYGSTRPFYFFADHEADLAARIRAGRSRFLSQFSRCAATDVCALQPDPSAVATFEASRLAPDDSPRSRASLALHRDLLQLRRADPTLADRETRWDGATISDRLLFLRALARDGRDRLLVVNLGVDLDLARVTHPFVAPPGGARWSILWSSEARAYGGSGTPPLEEQRWLAPGHAAIVLGAA